jgi:hypothetical protein
MNRHGWGFDRDGPGVAGFVIAMAAAYLPVRFVVWAVANLGRIAP